MRGRSKLAAPAAALLALGLVTGCSDGSDQAADPGLTIAQVRKRPCSLVSAAVVSKALEHRVTARSEDGLPCTYTPKTAGASGAVVELRTGAAADDPERLVPNGRPVDDLGSAAQFDPQGGPLGPRLVAREAGTLVIVDVGPVAGEDAQSQAVAIARAALDRAPASKVAKGSGPNSRSEVADPCGALGDGEALSDTLDVPVQVTPAYPAGCTVTATGRGAVIVQAEPLSGDGAKVLDALERSADGKAWTKRSVAGTGDAAVWLGDPTTPGAGILTVVSTSDDALLTFTTDGGAGTSDAGRQLAALTARAALD